MPHAQGGSERRQQWVSQACSRVLRRYEPKLCYVCSRARSWWLYPPEHALPVAVLQLATFAQGAAESVRKIRSNSYNLFSALPPAARSAANCRPPSFIPRLSSAIASRARRSKSFVIIYIYIYYTISFRAASSALPQKNIFIITVRKPHFCSIAPEFWFANIRMA